MALRAPTRVLSGAALLLPLLFLVTGGVGAWPPDAVRDFERAVKAGNKVAILAAAEALQQEPTPEGVEALIKYGPAFPNFEVYVACRDALAAAVEGKARAELLKGLQRSRAKEQRVLCADALAAATDLPAIDALGLALQDREGVVRIAATRSLCRIMRRDCVPLLFERLGVPEVRASGTELDELQRALFLLTGQRYDNVADWRNYWAAVPADFDPRTRRQTPENEQTTRTHSSGEIFESDVASNAFVLVLDISSSMRVIDLPPGETWTDANGRAQKYRDPGMDGQPDPGSRFMRAKAEFTEFIHALTPATRFALVVFGSREHTRLWRPQLVQANEQNKRQAAEWVQGLQWSPATETDVALEMAFSVPEADTIYLFSDGIPERLVNGQNQDIPQDEVIEKALTLNRSRHCRIHCFGFLSISNATRAFLQRLAAQNEGEYRDIR